MDQFHKTNLSCTVLTKCDFTSLHFFLRYPCLKWYYQNLTVKLIEIIHAAGESQKL